MTSVATRAKPLGGIARSNRLSVRLPTDSVATMHERFVFAMLNLVGKWVTVTVKSGQEFMGILHTCCPDKEIGVVLSMAREKLGPDQLVPKTEERMIILSSDFVQLAVNDVDLYTDEIIGSCVRNQGEVLADSEIEVAGRGAGSERELEMATSWLTSTVDSNLDLGSKSDLKAWDQFAYNEQRHGVVSSYSDELYTTKISDKQFTPEQLAMAERLAREIETKTSTNAHVLEERGQKDLDDGDMDEEEKYSMVLDPSRVETAAPSTEPAASIAAAEPAAEPLMAPSTEPSAPAEAPALSSWSTSAAPATKAPVFSKLRATASEFVPMRVQVVRPPTGPSPPQGAPPAPPQGVPPNGMYQMQGGMMQMQGGMPITPGGQGMPQQGMMMGHMSHEQAQHAAQQQQAAQAQQMAMMQQQQRAQMPPGANSMMMPMQGGLRPGMVVPTVMAPVGMGPQSMPAGPMMVQQGMMPPNMMPQHGMFPSGNARPVPPQQPMPPRMHGPHSGPGPRMMPQGGMQQGGYPQGGMPMGMRGQPSYSSGMGGYGGPQMQARPEG